MVPEFFQPEKSLRTLSTLAGVCCPHERKSSMANGNKTLLDNFVIFCVPLEKWFFFFFSRSSVSLLPHSTDFLKSDFHIFFPKVLQGLDGPCHFTTLFNSQFLKFPKSRGS